MMKLLIALIAALGGVAVAVQSKVNGGLGPMSETYTTNNLQLVGNHLVVYF
ncbi:hypothetical protein ACFPOH_07490 [Ureibacillus suwonensis]|uniref:Uncharacterized protein n=1 Tax=Ureibacillus suwonensis TaxID=313007 RepID=A0ABW0R9Z5_9BACL